MNGCKKIFLVDQIRTFTLILLILFFSYQVSSALGSQKNKIPPNTLQNATKVVLLVEYAKLHHV
ncbi:hypothetical protein [Cysteiniphilum halobium]|uniref:hypothetical protein n=1 Tax=Cysteiniphilum halobium TaxID=2219059 RepID=UPI000E64BE62|nr:hypothetical protein [Cysteiniphilum halobium]